MSSITDASASPAPVIEDQAIVELDRYHSFKYLLDEQYREEVNNKINPERLSLDLSYKPVKFITRWPIVDNRLKSLVKSYLESIGIRKPSSIRRREQILYTIRLDHVLRLKREYCIDMSVLRNVHSVNLENTSYADGLVFNDDDDDEYNYEDIIKDPEYADMPPLVLVRDHDTSYLYTD